MRKKEPKGRNGPTSRTVPKRLRFWVARVVSLVPTFVEAVHVLRPLATKRLPHAEAMGWTLYQFPVGVIFLFPYEGRSPCAFRISEFRGNGMESADGNDRAGKEQWFHLAEGVIDLCAYRATRESREPVAFVWQGLPRPRELERFIHSAKDPGDTATVYAFADDNEVSLPLSKWKLDNFRDPLPGLKFLRIELFKLGDHSDVDKPELAAWTPVVRGRTGIPIEGDVGALISPHAAFKALPHLVKLISETSPEDCGDADFLRETLITFFDRLQ